jgi:hypothetical protein
MNSFPQNFTIVLVHGAWADGSCWRDVVLPLERQGLMVICAPIPLTSLTVDVAALTRALERTSGPVVLVGLRRSCHRGNARGASEVVRLCCGARAR